MLGILRLRESFYCRGLFMVFAGLFVILGQSHIGLADQQKLEEISNDHAQILASDIVLGNRGAKLVVIEYFSPTCSHCADLHKLAFPELKHKYIDTGLIAYVRREIIGNKQDLDASILSRCANDAELYTKIMNQILSTQEQWVYRQDYRQMFISLAGEYELSKEQCDKCLADENMLKIPLSHLHLLSGDKDFLGTPSFYVNGQLLQDAYNFETLSKAINDQLGGVNK